MRGAIIQAVLFVAVIAVAGTFAGMMVTETVSYAEAIEGHGERAVAAYDAEILFVDDSEAGTAYDSGAERVRFHVKNVGGSTLDPAALDLLVDGHHLDPETTVLDSDSDRWREGSVVRVTANRTLSTGDHRAVATIHGQDAILEFERPAG